MYYLENSHLKVSILDPNSAADQERMGPRFCTGNYIWQVEKKGYGPLLSGPCYPDPHPPVSDGQGLPEVFQPLDVDKDTEDGDSVIVIGVGQVAYHHHKQIIWKKQSLLQLCHWEVEVMGQSIYVASRQESGSQSIRIIREANLSNNVLKIKTTLQNTGKERFSFCWFAHPFYPVNDGEAACKLYFNAKMQANAGFRLAKDQRVIRNKDAKWQKGHFQGLEDTDGEKFKAKIYYPGGTESMVSGDFPLKKVALWANAKTFSIEPFYEQQLAPSDGISWELTYTF